MTTGKYSLEWYIQQATVKVKVGKSQGSGFFIPPYGCILTAYHCVGDNAPKILVESPSLGTKKADLDEENSLRGQDIAILKVDWTAKYRLPLGVVPENALLTDVISVGYPVADFYKNASKNPSVFKGTISNITEEEIFLNNVIKGKGQSGGCIYHCATNRVIGIAKQIPNGDNENKIKFLSKFLQEFNSENKFSNSDPESKIKALLEGWQKLEFSGSERGTRTNSLLKHWQELKTANDEWAKKWDNLIKGEDPINVAPEGKPVTFPKIEDKLTCQKLQDGGILKALSDSFIKNGVFDKSEAHKILKNLGFPLDERLRNSETSLYFWQRVCLDIEYGKVSWSLNRLLCEVAKINPQNPAFTQWRK